MFYIIDSATAGKDYAGLPNIITFTSEQIIGEVSCTNITVIDDSIVEGVENFNVKLLSDFSGAIVSRSLGTIEITDNDGGIINFVGISLTMLSFFLHRFFSLPLLSFHLSLSLSLSPSLSFPLPPPHPTPTPAYLYTVPSSLFIHYPSIYHCLLIGKINDMYILYKFLQTCIL